MSTTDKTKLLDSVASQLANATSTLLNKAQDVTNGLTISTTAIPVISNTPKPTAMPSPPVTSPVETSTTSIVNSTNTTSILSTTTIASNATTTIIPEGAGSPAMVFISVVIFIVAVALIVKIILSNRKKRTELIGSARWRISASQQSGTGPTRTAASYVPMNNRGRTGAGGFDSTGPGEAVVDWERQFFDDSEPTIAPSRLQLHREDEY